MHESSAAEALVKMALEAAADRGRDGAPARVAAIRLVVGEATGYMEESLSFYLRAYAAGTPVEGARLEIEYVKPEFRCSSCGAAYQRKRFGFDCPICGGPGILVSMGSEFYVDSIEIEE